MESIEPIDTYVIKVPFSVMNEFLSEKLPGNSVTTKADRIDIFEELFDVFDIVPEDLYAILDRHICCTRHNQRCSHISSKRISGHCYKDVCVCHTFCMECECLCRQHLRYLIEMMDNIGVDIRNE
jgi:hypothetical protein